MNLLRVDIHKEFSSRKLRRFRLQVEFTTAPGVTVIFGPSGAGKTTILQCIAGLTAPDSGQIAITSDESNESTVLFDSSRRIDLSPQERGVGYVFQDLALFPHLTAAENVAFGIRANGARRTEIVRETLERFRIAHVASHRPGEISGGERQRVALARTLVTSPRVLLLDEPFSALDDPLKLAIIDDLKDWLSRVQIPVLFVTHDRSEASALGQRVLRINEGTIDRTFRENR